VKHCIVEMSSTHNYFLWFFRNSMILTLDPYVRKMFTPRLTLRLATTPQVKQNQPRWFANGFALGPLM
jgi:hypothetical protein